MSRANHRTPSCTHRTAWMRPNCGESSMPPFLPPWKHTPSESFLGIFSLRTQHKSVAAGMHRRTHLCALIVSPTSSTGKPPGRPSKATLDRRNSCAAPCTTGDGGRSASEYCRNQFHLFVLRALSDGKTLQDALPLAMADCNAVYNEKAEKAGSNAGTTAALLFIAEDDDGGATLVTANVGDCRIVFFSGGKAVDLTRDHKPTNEAEKQRIESLGGEVVYNSGAWRVNGVLTVSRAIGSVRSCQKYLSCVPDIITHKLQPTDQFAVIASDGLWNVMSSEEVVDFVVEAKAEIDAAGDVMGREEGAMDADEEEEDDSGSMTYQLIADGLVSHAIDDLKSDDNVTVIIVFFDHSYREKCE
eukprot:TRINITY_DN2392_c0_g1_i1.p1 TRINITY_DN2392_c0_g1~~TRINITY_DN2392_c0_g1_i1.p1  ORF type:complete len:358 (-),score=37.62 TRINITY_DN2392_c0_g1_i1:259-1332(-)